MIDDGQALHSSLSLSENTRDGLAPGFSQDGYIKTPHVALIKNGRMADALVSPRSAKEYGIATNGASAQESAESFDLSAGTLAQADALKALDTGIFVGNLWYLNFSDRMNCRMTGMTRFATFWVENGEIKAPLNVMRFDDTAYNIVGENLISLTAERDFMPDSASYGERSTASNHLPGALVSSFKLTL
jgi:predicted Zn-dependent protease